MKNMKIHYRQADLEKEADQKKVISLIRSFFASMGEEDKFLPSWGQSMAENLRKFPTTRAFLAEKEDKSIALALCFLGFTTYENTPLLNLHDFVVLPEYRGQGVGTGFFAFLEDQARQMGCGRMTLEVNHTNPRAKKLYKEMGYTGSDLDKPQDRIYFLKKNF